MSDVDWRSGAERLAGDLGRRGFLRNEALRRAFAETPRHLFVPTYYRSLRSDQGGGWAWGQPVGQEDPAWLATVYSDQALVTQYKPRKDGDGVQISSSSSMPSLMADMIGELGIEPGLKVLEVGTGTGYNAAILCHLLGDENVTTIDIDPDLRDEARERLARLGYHPSFVAEDATYDRVLATHSVERIPPEWVRWTKPGGVILTDLRSPYQARGGEWAKLTVDDGSDTATGRLLPARGGFMGARTTSAFVESGPIGFPANWELLRKRTTHLPRAALDDDDFSFFLWWHVPGVEWFAVGSDHTNVNAPGGRHADVHDSGVVCFILLGDIWETVERAHQTWDEAGRPRVGDWTLTVTDDGRTTLAESEELPDSPGRWGTR